MDQKPISEARVMGNGDVWLNTGTLEEPHWELMMPDYEKQGIAINEEPHNIKVHETMNKARPNGKYKINWDGPLVKSRNFDLAGKVFYHFPRQVGKTAWLEAAPSVDENSHWYTSKEDTMQQKIAHECDVIEQMLVEKNESYGNSALDPVRVFSTADKIEQLKVRLDDKLSRIQRGLDYGDEDTILDLIGYLVLLRIALKEEQ